MTIRIIVQAADAGMAAVPLYYKTFDIDAPEIEQYFLEKGTGCHLLFCGWTILPKPKVEAGGP